MYKKFTTDSTNTVYKVYKISENFITESMNTKKTIIQQKRKNLVHKNCLQTQ